jgi:hypothetical protein
MVFIHKQPAVNNNTEFYLCLSNFEDFNDARAIMTCLLALVPNQVAENMLLDLVQTFSLCGTAYTICRVEGL